MSAIYFIDPSVTDYQNIINGLDPNSTIVVLQADQSGLEQISAYLVDNEITGLDAIHIVSDGAPGTLTLGNGAVTTDTLSQNIGLLDLIGQSLSATGDILLYGCNVGQDVIGQEFIDTLALWTGADIAASADLTGAAIPLGGNSILEAVNAGGLIDTVTLDLSGYTGVLAANTASYTDTSVVDSFADNTGTLSFTGADAITGGSSGSWTISGTTYTDMKVGTYGTLYVKDGSASSMMMMGSSTAGTYRYVANADAINALNSGAVTDVFSITGSSTDTLTVTLNGVNDSPVLDASKSPVLFGQTSDLGAPSGAVGTLVSSLVEFSSAGGVAQTGGLDNIIDADSGAKLGIVLTAVDTTNGSWFYSLNGGTTWTAVGTVSATSALLLAANTNTRLYFQSNTGYTGTVANAITFKAWDQFTGSGTAGTKVNPTATAFSTATDTAAITIIPANNHAPTLDTPATFSYTDTSAIDSFSNSTGTLSGSDSDVGQTLSYSLSSGTTGGATVIGGVTYDVSKAGLDGTLYVKSSNGQYVFVPNAVAINALSANSSDTYSVTVTDGFVTTSNTLTVNLIGVNDAPVLDVSKSPALANQAINAAAPSGAVGTLVAGLVDFSSKGGVAQTGGLDNISDADSGALLGIAITGIDSSNGVWYYSTNAGSTWTVVSTVSANNALLLAADTNSRVYFQPNAGYIGNASFTIKAWDQSSGTAGTKVDTSTGSAFSTATDSVAVAVAPTGVYNLYTDTSLPAETFTEWTGTLTDAGSDSIQGGSTGSWTISGTTYTDMKVGTYGTLYVKDGSSSSMMMMGSSTAGTYRYVANASAINALGAGQAGQDVFSVDTTSSSMMGSSTVTDVLKVYVNGANDVPVLNAPTAINLVDTSAVDSFTNKTGNLSATDVDAGTVLSYGINGGTVSGGVSTLTNTYGTLAVTVATGSYTFTPNANAINALALGSNPTASFTVTAFDGSLTGSNTLTINLTGANDTPILSTSTAISLTDTAAVDSFAAQTGSLSALDAENSSLSYGISGGAVSGGVSTLTNTYGTLAVTVATGAYTFTPNASAINALASGSNPTASFTVTASDGSLTGSNTLTISLTGANDTPIPSTPTAISLTDTAAVDSFAVQTGSLNAIDAEGSALTYGISGGTVSGGVSTLTNTYGTLAVTVATGAYTFTPNASAINALASGSNPTASFTVTASDGNSTGNSTLTVNLTGANDTPIVDTPTAISLTDTAAVDTFIPVMGKLNATDADTGATLTYGITGGTVNNGVSTLIGNYGTLLVTTANGDYSYIPSDTAINALSANATDSFTVTASDGSLTGSNTLTVNLTGANDAPILIEPTAISLTDTAITDTFVVQTGSLSATDAESSALIYGISGGTVTNGISTLVGDYGTLAVDITTGKYSFIANAIAINALAFGLNPTASFTVTASDDSLTSSNTLTVNLTGANDTPIVATPTAISLIDTAAADTFAVQTGTFSASDAEGGALTYGISGGTVSGTTATLVGNYGTLAVDVTTGAYSFTPNATAINGLTTNAVDDFTVTAFDGSLTGTNTLTVNLTGANDTPELSVISGVYDNGTGVSFSNGVVQLLDTSAVSTIAPINGILQASDRDVGSVPTFALSGAVAVTDPAQIGLFDVWKTSSYGDLYLNSKTGVYKFVPDNVAVDALKAGVNANSVFSFTANDTNNGISQPQTLTINVTGANDAPVTPLINAATIENAATTISIIPGQAFDAEGDAINISGVSGFQWAGSTSVINPVTKANLDLSTLIPTISTDGSSVVFTAPAQFDWMVSGQSITCTFNYTVQETANTVSKNTGTVTWVINGQTNDALGLNWKGTANADVKVGTAYEDILQGMNGNDNLSGGDKTDALYGGNGNDTLDGGNGIDYLYGDAGNDIMLGGADADFLYGGSGNDQLNGGIGDDSLSGDTGDDILLGELGNDTLFGGAGDDQINGGDGNDLIIGGSGDDKLTGGLGVDTFVFSKGSGEDMILDFNVSQDVIQITSDSGITNYAQLQHEMDTEKGGVEIDMDKGGEVFLVGVDIHSLTAANFLFVA